MSALPFLPDTIAAWHDARVYPPPQSRERRLVLCLDGTGDQYDEDNSNIVKLFASLRKDSPSQLTYYQAGIGTYTNSWMRQVRDSLHSALDMAVGASLGEHVRAAYEFLMQNYRQGDKIYLFGFSRGAYTARALAGMLYKVGLLPADNQAQVPFAYQWYTDESEMGWSMSNDFKRTFSMDVDVEFMGCFDTVASVGLIPRTLPFAKSNSKAVTKFRHAISLDERRIKFLPSRWPKGDGEKRTTGKTFTVLHGRLADEARAKLKKGSAQSNGANAVDVLVAPMFHYLIRSHGTMMSVLEDTSIALLRVTQLCAATLFGMLLAPLDRLSSLLTGKPTVLSPTTPGDVLMAVLQAITLWIAMCVRRVDNWLWLGHFDREAQKEAENRFEREEEKETGQSGKPDTDVVEVFFAGEHSDVGGGAVLNTNPKMASRIPLRWMIRQTFACDTGLLYRTEILAEHGLDVDTLWPRLMMRMPALLSHLHAAHPKGSLDEEEARDMFPSAEDVRKAVRRRIIPSSQQPTSSIVEGQSQSANVQQTSHGGASPAASGGEDLVSDANLSPETQITALSSSSASRSTRASSIVQPGDLPAVEFKQGASKHSRTSSSALAETTSMLEDFEDRADSMMPLHDQLVEKKAWWLLELFPLRFRAKLPDGTLRKVRAPHLGRYRVVTDKKPLMHYTVALRLLQNEFYQVHCPTTDDAEWQVVV